MAAFELARAEGADMIEFDVRPTADGALAVFHDETTERWNGRPEPIARLSWAELSRLRIGGEPVPTLDEVCRWARAVNMRLNVELKARGIEESVAAILRRYEMVDQVIVSSFYLGALLTLRTVAPELRRGVLMGIRSSRPNVRIREAWPFQWLRRIEAVAWHPAWQLPFLDRTLPRVRRRGYQVNVWTVDDPAVIRRLIALGVDGIISNYPARLREVVDSTVGG